LNSRAQIRRLPDGRRLHMHDGPIDLIVEAFGLQAEVDRAYEAAGSRFTIVLDELCEELPILRQPWRAEMSLRGPIARRMQQAVEPYGHRTFITPMAAVAGAVAEEILESMTKLSVLAKAYVNDGGDIALYMRPGEEFCVGMVERPDRPSLFGTLRIHAAHPVRAIATSGWRGRSFSLGIADAVTVLARTAACADAAATMIANAVDLPGSDKIRRVAARELAPDSDLADLLITQSVQTLNDDEVEKALRAGASLAADFVHQGLIVAAALHLQRETRVVGIEAAATLQRSAEHEGLIHA
jgi:uncharacterized protein